MRKVLKSKAFLKTMSWLVVSGVIIAIPALVETGSIYAAFKVAFWACLFKTPVYWVHEKVWHREGKEKVSSQETVVTRRPLPVLCVCAA